MMVPPEWLVILPVAGLLLLSGLGVVFWRNAAAQAVIGIAGAIAMLVTAIALFQHVWVNGPVAMAMSGWDAPFGIVLVADMFSAGLVLVTAIIGVLITLFALGTIDPQTRSYGFYPMVLALLAGVAGGFLTGDVFNLYVWLEVMLISSFGLLVLGGSREQIDGAVKYAAVNLVATTLFLVATGLLYGVTGTLNMADLSGVVAEIGMTPTLQVVAALYLVALGMKAAAFPLFFWLPASYHTPAPVVSALFAALLTKVGVYALYRVFTLIFPMTDLFADAVLIVAFGTMLFGALGALAQTDLRRMVAFLVIAGIGYMLVGLGLGGSMAFTGSITYFVHSMLITAALFMAAGLARWIGGSTLIGEIGGVYRAAPLFAMLVLCAVLAMGGMPPFSGLWPKIILIKAGLDAEAVWTIVFILVSAFVTLAALGRAFALGIWRDREDDAPPVEAARLPAGAVVSFAMLVVLTTAIGVWPAPLVEFAERAADGLLDPGAYTGAVLGDAR